MDTHRFAHEEKFEDCFRASQVVCDISLSLACTSRSSVWRALCLKGFVILRSHSASTQQAWLDAREKKHQKRTPCQAPTSSSRLATSSSTTISSSVCSCSWQGAWGKRDQAEWDIWTSRPMHSSWNRRGRKIDDCHLVSWFLWETTKEAIWSNWN